MPTNNELVVLFSKEINNSLEKTKVLTEEQLNAVEEQQREEYNTLKELLEIEEFIRESIFITGGKLLSSNKNN